MMIWVSDGEENIVRNGENADSHHFLLFPQCSQNLSFVGPWKSGVVWVRVKGKVHNLMQV